MTGVLETHREHGDRRLEGIIPWIGAPGGPPPGGIERRESRLRERPNGAMGEIDVSEEDSTGVLEEYFRVRNIAADREKPVGEELAAIQREVGSWLVESNVITNTAATTEDYSYDHPLGARAKIVSLIDHLVLHHNRKVSSVELEASRLFLRSAYAMYESTPKGDDIHLDEDGTFAFLVPARMSRKNAEYGTEVESVIPAFRYIPNEMRAAMMLGLPPFVIDTYPRDADGRRGYLIFVPVYPDSKDDLAGEGVGTPIRIARQKVDSAVRLAHNRLGASLVGLGAMLPSMTNYGRSVTTPGVITTTGHGGTVQLMLETMKRAVAERRITPDKLQKIGVLGLGAIGGSMAQIIKEVYPSSELFVYDTEASRLRSVARDIGAVACSDERQVLESSGVTIAALPDVKMDLASIGISPRLMRGKLIIDDSQPAVFNAAQVESYGATLTWVVGESRRGVMRNQYTYGDTLVGRAALFGCEAEIAALAAEWRSLQARGKGEDEITRILQGYAIASAVTSDKVNTIGKLFKKHHITAAPLQAAGKLL